MAAPRPAQMANGEKLYKGSCVACHELDGSGAPRIYPPLPGNANLQSANPASAIKIVLDGAETITTARAPNTGSMPPYASKMSDQEVADVVTYIRNAWGNAAPAVTAGRGREGKEVGRPHGEEAQAPMPTNHFRSSLNTNFGISHL